MADKVEIKCVNKSDRPNPHERIRAVGGFHNGKSWKLSQEDAIKGIESGRWEFFVNVRQQVVKVIVATSRFGHKYIKTVNDGEAPNNLLSLPECI